MSRWTCPLRVPSSGVFPLRGLCTLFALRRCASVAEASASRASALLQAGALPTLSPRFKRVFPPPQGRGLPRFVTASSGRGRQPEAPPLRSRFKQGDGHAPSCASRGSRRASCTSDGRLSMTARQTLLGHPGGSCRVPSSRFHRRGEEADAQLPQGGG